MLFRSVSQSRYEGKEIVEEVKGYRTQDYVIRMKLFIHKYGERYVFIEI